MIDGVLYVTTPYNNIAAISADTGKELWRFDGEAYKLGPIPGTGFKHRGAAVWRDGANLRVFLNSRTRLFSIRCEDRQARRVVWDARVGVAGHRIPKRLADERQVTQGSPPVVYRNLVVVAHAAPIAINCATIRRESFKPSMPARVVGSGCSTSFRRRPTISERTPGATNRGDLPDTRMSGRR